MGKSRKNSAEQQGRDGSFTSPGPRIQPNIVLETGRRRASRNGAVVFGVTVALLAAALVLVADWLITGAVGAVGVIVAVVAAALASSSIHVVLEWEKVVVLRLGRFNRVSGPGLVFTWPIIEYCTARIDQRVCTTYFGAEETLTSDLVPVNVDAVILWMVFSPRKATVEVEDYAALVSWIAQTTLRKAIGRATVAQVAARRDQLDSELKGVLEGKLSDWGIDIIDVEIRDIILPKDLQRDMATGAIAERKRSARLTMAEAERDISEMLMDASEVYGGDEEAMRLRTMHLAYESVEESGGTVVIPSAFSEGFVPQVSPDLEKAMRN